MLVLSDNLTIDSIYHEVYSVLFFIPHFETGFRINAIFPKSFVYLTFETDITVEIVYNDG